MAGLRLTLLGHEISEIFGSNLPSKKTLRIFYSPIQRCKETAIDIFEGFKKVSQNATLEEPLKELYDIGVQADYFYKEITKYPEIQFLFRWAANLYPANKVTPFKKYCQYAWETIIEKNKNALNRSIDIHVSHDLIILAYRLGWFGLPPNG